MSWRVTEFPRLPDAVFSLPAVSGSSLWTSYPSSGKFLKRMIPPAAEKWVGKDIPLKNELKNQSVPCLEFRNGHQGSAVF